MNGAGARHLSLTEACLALDACNWQLPSRALRPSGNISYSQQQIDFVCSSVPTLATFGALHTKICHSAGTTSYCGPQLTHVKVSGFGMQHFSPGEKLKAQIGDWRAARKNVSCMGLHDICYLALKICLMPGRWRAWS